MASKAPISQKVMKTLLIAAGAVTILVTAAMFMDQRSQAANIPKTHPGQPPVFTEFGDFQCPHCANFAFRLLPKIKEELVNNGELAFEYRHYPFLGNDSVLAAQAAECARDQGKFTLYHDALFLNLVSEVPHTRANLVETADVLQLNTEEFSECLESENTKAKVESDRQLGKALKVRGTPSLFINYTPINWSTEEDLLTTLRQHTKKEGTQQP